MMMPNGGRVWNPYAGSYGRPSYGTGARPGAGAYGSPARGFGAYGNPYGRTPRAQQGTNPAAARARQPQPRDVRFDTARMHDTKDVNDVTDAQETRQAEPAAQQAPGAQAAPEPEVVEAEVIEPAPDAQLDEELETAAAEAVATAIEESELVKKAQAEMAEWKDKYLRLHAEWDTYRRRMGEQRAAEKALANEKMVESLLPVLDDFERTIAYANDNGEVGLLGGVQAVYAKLVNTLEKDGVEVIDPVGEAYDALAAQAVGTVPDDTVPDETVAQVYQKGYRMGSKVLRPAMVTVTTGGPAREKAPEAEGE